MLLTVLRQLIGRDYPADTLEPAAPSDAAVSSVFSEALMREGDQASDAFSGSVTAVGVQVDATVAGDGAVGLMASQASSLEAAISSEGTGAVGLLIASAGEQLSALDESSRHRFANSLTLEPVESKDLLVALAFMMASGMEPADAEDAASALGSYFGSASEEALAVDAQDRVVLAFVSAFGEAKARDLVKLLGPANAARVASILSAGLRRERIIVQGRTFKA